MQKSLRVLVVDDEEMARMRLRGLVGENPDPTATVVGEAANAMQALNWLAHNECDVLLLDIHMPGHDGLQLAAEIKQRARPPEVIFVTAYAEHAVTAFDLNAADYLTKPVRRERLQAALQRVAQRQAQRPALTVPNAGGEPVIVVSELGRVVRVPVSEVLYLKAELKYVTLRTTERTYVLDDALSDLEQRLGEHFLRIHRNTLVARRALRALERRKLAVAADDDGTEGWAVCVRPLDEWLAVSRRQLAAVREAMTGSSS